MQYREHVFNILLKFNDFSFSKSISLKDSFKRYLFEKNIKDSVEIITIKKIVYGIVKNKNLIEFILKKLDINLKKTKFEIQIVLMMAIYEILFTKNKDYAILNESCNLLKLKKFGFAVGFLNANLRKFLRLKPTPKIFIKQELKKLEFNERVSIQYSYSKILIDYLLENFGKLNALKFCIFSNKYSKIFARINRIKSDSQGDD